MFKMIKNTCIITDMKKSFYLVLGAICLASLTSCGGDNSKAVLSFGQEYSNVEEVYSMDKDSTYNNFKYATQNKESFVAIIYNSYTCSCYVDLRLSTRDYLLNNQIDIFTANANIFDGQTEKFGINLPNSSSFPTICLFKKGKLTKQINYSRDNSIFTKSESFEALIEENFFLPKIIHTNFDELVTKFEENEEFLIYYRQESCSDCAAFSQRFVQNYLNENYSNLNNTKFYMVDKDWDVEDVSKDWVNYKNQFGLSNENNDIGYATGFVPTVQKIVNGNFDGMMVYLNDKIVDKVVTRTYYTEEIISKQNYLKEAGVESFLNKTVNNENDIFEYHNKNAKLFFDYYLL